MGDPLISVYWRGGFPSQKQVLPHNTFGWIDQKGTISHFYTIWPQHMEESRSFQDVREKAMEVEDVEDVVIHSGQVIATEIEGVETEAHGIGGEGGELEENNIDTTAPLRLFDCENEVLKDQATYLLEENNIVPSYIVVSQVWGEIKEQLSFPTIGWLVPTSNKAKWEAILGYCKRESIKWLWMDVLCINQASNSLEANQEKAKEIPKMSHYYRGATACLVIPQDFVTFPTLYAQVMHIKATIVDTGASIRDNADKIWEGIGVLDQLMGDQWFWRMWTYQELLLPKKLILLDGEELQLLPLWKVVAWYYSTLRDGVLKKPDGGRDYDFIDMNAEMVTSRQWFTGYQLGQELDQRGHLNLIDVIKHTMEKKCTNNVDRLLGLYGLLSKAEKVPIDADTVSQTDHSSTVALEGIWQHTVYKVVVSGSVWPLLHDGVDPAADSGTNWMPRLLAPIVGPDGFYFGGFAAVHSETAHHINRRKIQITERGLHIGVRVVGRIVGYSMSIGDGGGEMNKLLACVWLLTAKGFCTVPVIQQLKHGLTHWSMGMVPSHNVETIQAVLEAALHSNTLIECFRIVEENDLRRKLVYGDGFFGEWNKTVVTYVIDGYSEPFVTVAYVHITYTPQEPGCWVLDVTSEPTENVKRWVVANKSGPRTFRKIGTMRSHPVAIEDTAHSIILD